MAQQAALGSGKDKAESCKENMIQAISSITGARRYRCCGREVGAMENTMQKELTDEERAAIRQYQAAMLAAVRRLEAAIFGLARICSAIENEPDGM